MRFLPFLVCILCFEICAAQKLIKKIIVNPSIESVSVDLSNCYSLDINTSATDEIIVSGTVAGADNEQVLVNLENSGNNIEISTGFQPNYEKRGSKFGALTYVAIDLQISIPQNLWVTLFGTSTQLCARGEYQRIDISLADGNCTLNGRFRNAKVKTQKGDIIVKAAKGDVSAESTYGKVHLKEMPAGDSTYELSSVQGNIYVNRTD